MTIAKIGTRAALVAVGVLALSASVASAQGCQAQVGAQGAAPFTVWYCAGDEFGRQQTGTVARMLDQVWSEETRPEPDGLGPPIAPTANNGRISVYVTAPHVEVALGRCPDFCHSVGDLYGFAVGTAPFIKTATGTERSSALMILNERIGITDATVIHEFFHVLQYAHTSLISSWLDEASSTWAEYYYRASETGRVHSFREFQASTTSALSRKSLTHEYGAYVWLVWLTQRARSPSAVFRLWSALEHATSDKPADVDHLVRSYLAGLGLGWGPSFNSFAVEGLNRNLSSVTPQLFSRGPFGDPAVPLGVTPRWVRPPWTLGVRARRTAVNLPQLSVHYEYVRGIAPTVKAVTISSSRIRPWGDVIVLAHSRLGWQRRDVNNGSFTFCRQTGRGNIDQLYLIADNHDDLSAHSGGSYTVTGRRTC